MDTWLIILIIIASYIVLMILYSLFAYLLVNKSIAKRTDKNPILRYFTAADYPQLKATPLSFKNRKGTELRGFIYDKEQTKTDSVVIFFHGFGAGHQAYTTLIHDLVETLNLPVAAFDYTGCDLSDGKKIPNTLQALSDGHDFLTYITSQPQYKKRKLILIGHSWGGFVATNLPPFNRDKKISHVVSLSGVTDFPLIYRMRTKAPFIFIPINNLLNYFRYRGFAFATTKKSIKDTSIPHLFIHGEKDEAIPFNPFVSVLVLQSDKYHKVKFHIEKEKYHNVYLTNESEASLRLLQRNLKASRRHPHDDTYKTFIAQFDFNTAVINDPNILTIIKNFVRG